MKGILGLGLAIFTSLFSANGQVAVYRQHLVVSQTSPGFRSRTVQSGWTIVDLTTHQVATVSVNKKARQFSVEFSQSSQLIEQLRNKSSTTTTLQQGSLNGLRMKGINKTFDFGPGMFITSPKVLRATGSNSDVKFHGNLVFDEAATRDNIGISPIEGLQNIRNFLIGNSYTEQ